MEEVNFIGKMILDETMELFATVHEPSDAKAILKTFIDERYENQRIALTEGRFRSFAVLCSETPSQTMC